MTPTNYVSSTNHLLNKELLWKSIWVQFFPLHLTTLHMVSLYAMGNNIVLDNIKPCIMPMHTHGTSNLKAQLLAGGTPVPATPASKPSTQASFIGASGGGTGLANIWSSTLSDPVSVGGMGMSGNLDPAGANAPFSVMNPFLAINFCIAIEGLYPPHND